MDPDVLSTFVLTELKEMGIKHKGKKTKIMKNSSGHRLFHLGLQHLKLTDAFLANGTVVQVPQFLTEACSYILENSETEGIFRKAGSAAKQREIRKNLETGQPLGKLYRVIDVANIVSYFFRELPEPIIPHELHETLIRCLLISEPNRIRSIQLTCLLASPLNLHTLAYFMQFLQTITTHVRYNKMSAENLAIVIAPSVMPYRDINSVRFKNHIKLIEVLIKNSNIIGTIPLHIKDKLTNTSKEILNSVQTKKSVGVHCSAIKSKMRRSQIFHGLKTIVGSATHNTEHSVQKSGASSDAFYTELQPNCMSQQMDISPRIHSSIETFTKSVSGLADKNNKTRRLTLRNEGSIKLGHYSNTNATDRRWSLISTGWSKNKKKDKMLHNFDITMSDIETKVDPAYQTELMTTSSNNNFANDSLSKANSAIPKSEYDAIADRLAVISTKVPQNKLSYGVKSTSKNLNTFEENKSLRHIRKSIDKNLSRSPNKSITYKLHTPAKIIRQKTWHLSSEPKLSVKIPLSKIQCSHSKNTDILTLTPRMVNKQESDNQQSANIYFQDTAEKINYSHTNTHLEFSENISFLSQKKNRITNIAGPVKTPTVSKKSICFGSVIHIFDEGQGRESIARLRTENAGMVLAKTKLFNDFNY